ncbi:MAG: hypothetical protein P4L56_15620 [Candidatus Sulfopaludibacter sp.]|nr:hypothetical protein [Candidatus Sulfopaludibacter sp.]
MRTIANELEGITVGAPAHFGSLTIFPLLRAGGAGDEPDYMLLEEAIALGTARVTELGIGGSVPELRFENLGEKPVLLFDGEELIGAKQNRTVNLTILAPPKQSIVIPVSCVEAGRWRAESEEFRPACHIMYSRARAERAEQVTFSIATSGARQSNQGAVWDEIAAKSERMGTASPTQAMAAMYDSHAVSIDAYLHAFTWAEHQAGVLFAVGPQALGVDLLDRPETMRKAFPKFLRSYALDAVETPRSAPLGMSEATAFLAHVGGATPMTQPAIGMGKDVRLTGGGISGAALWAEQRYIHLCAFTTDGNGSPAGLQTRISRPRRRRAEREKG